jgi:hypothetical protein
MLLFVSMGWNCVSELRPPTGLLLNPPIIYEYSEPRWNDTDRRNRRTCRKPIPVPLCQPQNSTGTEPGSKTGFRGERPATNRLGHGAVERKASSSKREYGISCNLWPTCWWLVDTSCFVITESVTRKKARFLLMWQGSLLIYFSQFLLTYSTWVQTFRKTKFLGTGTFFNL